MCVFTVAVRKLRVRVTLYQMLYFIFYVFKKIINHEVINHELKIIRIKFKIEKYFNRINNTFCNAKVVRYIII